jgi:hypothetical protein
MMNPFQSCSKSSFDICKHYLASKAYIVTFKKNRNVPATTDQFKEAVSFINEP